MVNVHSFDKESFLKIITHLHEFTNADWLNEKRQLLYLINYLNTIKVKTFIVEEKYIDKDYLEDYSAYYVRSYNEYKKTCVRIHFFKLEITQKAFDAAILKFQEQKLKDIKESYAGFIILKPLPKTCIGRTALINYQNNQNRSFPANRSYEVNLKGINLTVNSIAWQEQDSTVAACASSALWSAFPE